ncbi:glycoside hydrolase superfamily [Russula brevipes]|nr:glycoside hydrolase superfamily [Russula brevipes]
MYPIAAAFWLFSVLSGLSPASAGPTRTSSRSHDSFVSASGTNFIANGKPFTFVGTNAYWLPYLNSEDDICNTLANMSQSGITVVRTWAFNDVTEIPESGFWLQLIKDKTTKINTGPNGFQRLDKFIALAKKYNIYVYLSLTNNWNPSVTDSPAVVRRNEEPPCPLPRNFLSNDYGGMDTYVRELGHAKKHDEFFTNPDIQCKFNEYVQFVVSRYVDEPGIIAWELANDARCRSTLNASEHCNTNTVTKWHADTAKLVRKHDPNHLIASGAHGFFCPSCPKLFPLKSPKPSPAPGKPRKRTLGGLMTPSKLFERIFNERRAAPRALDLDQNIRGRWMAPSEAKRQNGGQGSSFNGDHGVDTQDITNAPDINIGTFQATPDQNNYAPSGPGARRSNFDDTLDQIVSWIQIQAQSAQTIGKPVVLTAFGLVTQDNFQQFVPFNLSAPIAKSPHGKQKRQDNGSAGQGVSQQQLNNAYTTWLQTGQDSGVGGMTQYQWSADGLAPGTFVQAPPGSGNGAARSFTNNGISPNDGYGILGTDVQQILSDAAQRTKKT